MRKYYGRTAVIIPYIADDGSPARLHITINAPEGISKQKLYRGIQRTIKQNFGKKLSRDEITKYVQIINERDLREKPRVETPEQRKERLDREYLALQAAEDAYAAQNGGYTACEAAAPEKAEGDMPTLQEEPATTQ